MSQNAKYKCEISKTQTHRLTHPIHFSRCCCYFLGVLFPKNSDFYNLVQEAKMLCGRKPETTILLEAPMKLKFLMSFYSHAGGENNIWTTALWMNCSTAAPTWNLDYMVSAVSLCWQCVLLVCVTVLVVCASVLAECVGSVLVSFAVCCVCLHWQSLEFDSVFLVYCVVLVLCIRVPLWERPWSWHCVSSLLCCCMVVYLHGKGLEVDSVLWSSLVLFAPMKSNLMKFVLMVAG